jgi:hypothetical protein
VYDRRDEKIHGYHLPSPDARRYQRVVPQHGRHTSTVLGLDLGLEAGRLKFFHGTAELMHPPSCVFESPFAGSADGVRFDIDRSPSERATLSRLLNVFEIRVLAGGITFSVDAQLGLPFSSKGSDLGLAPSVLATSVDAEIALRHALELCLLERLAPGQESLATAVARALLACRAGALYAFSRLGEGQLPEAFPAWLRELMTLASAQEVSWRAIRAALGTHSVRLLSLQGFAGPVAMADVEAQLDRVAALFDQAREVAAPVEVLLTTGGDTRLRVDPDSGLNKYGCSPKPRPWAHTFASSTATSISEPAYAVAEGLRQHLLRAALEERLAPAFSAASRDVGRELSELCGFAADSDIVLTTSGTDAELYALFLTLLGSPSSVVNLLVGPGETGTNVVEAAAGTHYDSVTSHGVRVAKGTLIDRFFAGRVRVEGVPVRGVDGHARPAEDVDAEVERCVDEAVSAGSRVLLHVVDCSKTGLLAPSLRVVRRVKQRHRDAVDVVVDASQMRASAAALAAYDACGYLVILTGSKFVTGPPFSGALVVPRELAARARRCDQLPTGLHAYAAMDDFPPSWRLRSACPVPRNVGLLLRWRAALWELQAFRSVPVEKTKAILSTFGSAIRDAITRRPHLTLIDTKPIDRGELGTSGMWDSVQTVFTFTVARVGSGGMRRLASLAELKQLHAWLNQDVSRGLGDHRNERDAALAAKCCHIGQPVVVGHPGEEGLAALRIASGARLVSGVVLGPSVHPDGQQHPTEAGRLAGEVSDALFILEKLDLLLREYETLASGVASS